MEKINLKDFQKRDLKNFYLSWLIITKEIYVRNNDSCKEKRILYVILGTDISGNRQVIASLFENTYNNRFWLEFFEEIRARGTENILLAVVPKNKNLVRCLKIIYNKVRVITSPEEIVDDITQFFTERSARKFITNLKDLFFAKTLQAHEVEIGMFKEQFVGNKVVTMLLNRNENDIKSFYEYPYEIRKFLYPYYPIRDIKRELNKLNNLDTLCTDITEINTYFLTFINKYESRRSYNRAEWLNLLNVFYLAYTQELEEYFK